MAAGWRADRSALIPAAVVVVVLGIVGALALTGDDDALPPGTTATGEGGDQRFVIEGQDGTVLFDQDGDQASMAFEGPDGTGRLAFDLDGDGVVAEGEGGAFELVGAEPPGWPADFPLPAGAVAARGSVLGATGITQLSTTYAVAGQAPADVVAYFEEALADAGPIVEQEPGSPVSSVSFEGAWYGFLTVTPDDQGGTTLSVQLYVEEPGATPSE